MEATSTTHSPFTAMELDGTLAHRATRGQGRGRGGAVEAEGAMELDEDSLRPQERGRARDTARTGTQQAGAVDNSGAMDVDLDYAPTRGRARPKHAVAGGARVPSSSLPSALAPATPSIFGFASTSPPASSAFAVPQSAVPFGLTPLPPPTQVSPEDTSLFVASPPLAPATGTGLKKRGRGVSKVDREEAFGDREVEEKQLLQAARQQSDPNTMNAGGVRKSGPVKRGRGSTKLDREDAFGDREIEEAQLSGQQGGRTSKSTAHAARSGTGTTLVVHGLAPALLAKGSKLFFALFKHYGTIKDTQLLPGGSAFSVTFATPAEAHAALSAIVQREIKDRNGQSFVLRGELLASAANRAVSQASSATKTARPSILSRLGPRDEAVEPVEPSEEEASSGHFEGEEEDERRADDDFYATVTLEDDKEHSWRGKKRTVAQRLYEAASDEVSDEAQSSVDGRATESNEESSYENVVVEVEMSDDDDDEAPGTLHNTQELRGRLLAMMHAHDKLTAAQEVSTSPPAVLVRSTSRLRQSAGQVQRCTARTGARSDVGADEERALAAAIARVPLPIESKVGLCESMCPAQEQREREEKSELVFFELTPESTPDAPRTSSALAVKKYKRSDALFTIEAVNVRTVPALQRTVDHLLTVVVNDTRRPFIEVHNFVRDRLRSVAQDLSIQGLDTHPTSFSLLAASVRYFVLADQILCAHVAYDSNMTAEILSKLLISLGSIFDTCNAWGVPLPQEAEFRSYSLLTLNDPLEVTGMLRLLRPAVLRSPEVRRALHVRRARDAGDYSRFFALAEEADVMHFALMHLSFRRVRAHALRVMNRALGKDDRLPLTYIAGLLKFETEHEAGAFCEEYGLFIEDGMLAVRANGFALPRRTDEGAEGEEKTVFTREQATTLFAAKMAGFSLSQLVRMSLRERAGVAPSEEEGEDVMRPEKSLQEESVSEHELESLPRASPELPAPPLRFSAPLPPVIDQSAVPLPLPSPTLAQPSLPAFSEATRPEEQQVRPPVVMPSPPLVAPSPVLPFVGTSALPVPPPAIPTQQRELTAPSPLPPARFQPTPEELMERESRRQAQARRAQLQKAAARLRHEFLSRQLMAAVRQWRSVAEGVRQEREARERLLTTLAYARGRLRTVQPLAQLYNGRTLQALNFRDEGATRDVPTLQEQLQRSLRFEIEALRRCWRGRSLAVIIRDTLAERLSPPQPLLWKAVVITTSTPMSAVTPNAGFGALYFVVHKLTAGRVLHLGALRENTAGTLHLSTRAFAGADEPELHDDARTLYVTADLLPQRRLPRSALRGTSAVFFVLTATEAATPAAYWKAQRLRLQQLYLALSPYTAAHAPLVIVYAPTDIADFIDETERGAMKHAVLRELLRHHHIALPCIGPVRLVALGDVLRPSERAVAAWERTLAWAAERAPPPPPLVRATIAELATIYVGRALALLSEQSDWDALLECCNAALDELGRELGMIAMDADFAAPEWAQLVADEDDPAQLVPPPTWNQPRHLRHLKRIVRAMHLPSMPRVCADTLLERKRSLQAHRELLEAFPFTEEYPGVHTAQRTTYERDVDDLLQQLYLTHSPGAVSRIVEAAFHYRLLCLAKRFPHLAHAPVLSTRSSLLEPTISLPPHDQHEAQRAHKRARLASAEKEDDVAAMDMDSVDVNDNDALQPRRLFVEPAAQGQDTLVTGALSQIRAEMHSVRDSVDRTRAFLSDTAILRPPPHANDEAPFEPAAASTLPDRMLSADELLAMVRSEKRSTSANAVLLERARWRHD